MKISLITLICLCAFANAGADTNILVMSDWSQPITLRNEQLHDQYIRGRLLIVQGMEPAYGGPQTNGAMTFIELQNVTGACCEGISVYFDLAKLNCQLTDSAGKESLELSGGIWSGRGPFSPVWVYLPYNSTIRLFVNGGKLEPLSVYPGSDPSRYWAISTNDTNIYYLAGTIGLSTHSNLNLSPSTIERYYKEKCTAVMEFPRFRVLP